MKEKEEKLMRSVRFDKVVMDKIQKEAEKQNRSFNNMVDTIIKQYVKDNNL